MLYNFVDGLSYSRTTLFSCQNGRCSSGVSLLSIAVIFCSISYFSTLKYIHMVPHRLLLLLYMISSSHFIWYNSIMLLILSFKIQYWIIQFTSTIVLVCKVFQTLHTYWEFTWCKSGIFIDLNVASCFLPADGRTKNKVHFISCQDFYSHCDVLSIFPKWKSLTLYVIIHYFQHYCFNNVVVHILRTNRWTRMQNWSKYPVLNTH